MTRDPLTVDSVQKRKPRALWIEGARRPECRALHGTLARTGTPIWVTLDVSDATRMSVSQHRGEIQ